VRKNYQRKERKSNHKFEVVRGQELLVQVPLPMAEVWAVSADFTGLPRTRNLHSVLLLQAYTSLKGLLSIVASVMRSASTGIRLRAEARHPNRSERNRVRADQLISIQVPPRLGAEDKSAPGGKLVGNAPHVLQPFEGRVRAGVPARHYPEGIWN
jgi:hypothetical protein